MTGISVVSRNRTVGDGLAVEIDPRLPRSVWGRAVYHCEGSGRFLQVAHRHSTPHEFLVLAGRCVVGLQETPDSEVTWSKLNQADAVTVSGGVGHRMWLEPGCVFAAMSPSLAWLSTDDVITLSGPQWELP